MSTSTLRSESAAFDAIVVGGGPAGVATAIALAQRGLSAAIVERHAAPLPRVGETLPPVARVPLEALGVWEAFAADGHEPAVGTRGYWGSDRAAETHFVATPYGCGWHIDRCRFETMLIGAAEALGVVFFRGRRLEAVSGGVDSWVVRVPETLRARFLIDATGRASMLARLGGAERVSIDQLVAATLFLRPRDGSAAEPDDPHGQFTLIEATSDGWWYSAPLPGRRLVVACMTDADLAGQCSLRNTTDWLSHARAARATCERIGAYAIEGTPQLSSANTSRLSSVIGPAWLAVGDAAVSFDPLSSQGIVTALECALDAAGAIDRHLAGDRSALPGYAVRITDRYRQYLVERASYYGPERRWPGSVFWQRRQAHREVLHHAAAS